jgi:hypothetical protein
MSPQTLQQAAQVAAAVCLVLGAVASLATALSGILKVTAAALKLPADGKVAHAANACAAVGVDVGKFLSAAKSLLAKFGVGPAAALLVAVVALGSTNARADGCLGVPALHCGPSASLLEVRPGLPGPISLAPGIGPEADYHFKRWSLGGALFGNGLVQLVRGQQPATELSAAVFGCAMGLTGVLAPLNGSCAGPLVVVAGPNGGLAKGFTWKGSTGVVVNLAPDLLNFLSTAIPQL